MADEMKKQRELLRDAFIQDIRNAWRDYQTKHPERSVYAFVMYGVDGSEPYLWPAVLSQEALTDVAQRYVDDGLMDSVDEARDALRFSVSDGPDSFLFEQAMPAEKKALAGIGEDNDGWLGWDFVTDPAAEALKQLDREGFFGAGRKRDKILLLISIEDSLHDYCGESAENLNSVKAFRRYQSLTAVDGVYKSCGALAITGDGKHLLAANTVPKPRVPDDRVNQTVLYTMEGNELSRLWQYNFPTFGDSVRDMAISTDSGQLWTVRMKYVKQKPTALIEQFGYDSNKPLQSTKIAEEPAAIAASADGSRVALLTRESLIILDGSLKRIQSIGLHKGHTVTFLKDHTLLVGTADGMMRLEGGQLQSTSIGGEVISIDSDAANEKLAVGRWFDIENFNDKTEFGLRLFELATLQLIREFHYPGHQLVLPILSDDGTRLACMANRLHGDRTSIVVFDTETGKLQAESKSDFVRTLAYIPGTHTLVIPASGFMDKEPVLIWSGGEG